MSPFASPPNPKVFQSQVWDIARQIPEGKVSTYGQIASMIPPPGTLTLKDYEAFGAELQVELLRAEGVFFNEKGKIDFEKYGWNGPDPEWCKTRSMRAGGTSREKYELNSETVETALEQGYPLAEPLKATAESN
jgi:alkylated DNA nucleotide flippase Atl1